MRKFSEEDWGVYANTAEKDGDDEYGGGTVKPPPTKDGKP